MNYRKCLLKSKTRLLTGNPRIFCLPSAVTHCRAVIGWNICDVIRGTKPLLVDSLHRISSSSVYISASSFFLGVWGKIINDLCFPTHYINVLALALELSQLKQRGFIKKWCCQNLSFRNISPHEVTITEKTATQDTVCTYAHITHILHG